MLHKILIAAVVAAVPQLIAAQLPVNTAPANLVTLPGHVPPYITFAQDEGRTPDETPIPNVVVVLAQTADRQRALQVYLEGQNDRQSPDFRHRLSPEEFADRFGATPANVDAVYRWLEDYGLTASVSRSRVFISVEGNASQLASAFHTTFHTFLLHGKTLHSLIAEPSVPAEIAPLIHSISGLSQDPVKATPLLLPEQQAETLTSGNHVITPADFATIYDLNPVYKAGYSGSGQSIAVVGQSRVASDDVQNFAAYTNLTLSNPQVVLPPGSVDPGETNDDDQVEATLDVTRTSSVAPGATVYLVINAQSNGGTGLPMQYVIDNQVAQIMTVSFYGCEANAGKVNTDYYNALFSQGAAEGISIFISAGDGGVDSCEGPDSVPQANQQASINQLCASQNVTCVGGTEFNDADSALYWNPTNEAGHESAIGYIPEGAFNDPVNASTGALQIFAGGGGTSTYIPAPGWQVGLPGNSGFRTVPDISFSSSGHDGYLICLAYAGYPCVPNAQGLTVVRAVAGTSAATPSMAGIQALLDQEEGGSLGNINPALYRLATTPANSVFHDVTVTSSGITDCEVGTPSMCNNSTPSPTALQGGEPGYVVSAGYDLATGLGSLDAYNLLRNWNSTPALATPTVDLVLSQTLITAGQSIQFTASMFPANPIPTGTVQFVVNGQNISAPIGLAAGTASSTYSQFGTTQNNSVQAVYSGDDVYAPAVSEVMKFVVNPAGSPGFTVTATPITITLPGQSGSSSITVSPVGGFAGTVNLSCVNVTPVALGSCAFTPDSLTIGGGPAQAELVLTSSAPSVQPAMSSSSAHRLGRSTLHVELTLCALVCLLLPRKAYRKLAISVGAVCILGSILVACGHTGTSVTVTSSLNPGTTQEPIGFQVIVAGPAGRPAPTGTVQFLSNGLTIGGPVTVTNGVATISQTFTITGAFSIAAQYLGNSSYAAAFSPALNETITYKNPGTTPGAYSLLVQATSGGSSQTIPVSVTVQ